MGPRPAKSGSHYEPNQAEGSLLFQAIIRD